MPRNIIIPEEQQNDPIMLNMESNKKEVIDQKRSSMNSNVSEEQCKINIDTKWKTNLFIGDESERVQRRQNGYRKNTSFQNKIINDHILVMVESVCEMEEYYDTNKCYQICRSLSSKQSKCKEGIVQQKVHHLIDENVYFTQDEKHEIFKLFTDSFDNYQILMKTTNRLGEMQLMREQLVFILGKIVQYIQANYETGSRKYDRQFLQQQINEKLHQIIKQIVGHENIQVINPQYFYNDNESKYIGIIERWFYTVFAVKLGISSNKYAKVSAENQGEQCFL